jgi:hypothetical protein
MGCGIRVKDEERQVSRAVAGAGLDPLYLLLELLDLLLLLLELLKHLPTTGGPGWTSE